jgi:phospholipid transport system substrate-binding protein
MHKHVYAITLLGLCLLWCAPEARAGSATEDTKVILEKAMAIQTRPDLQSPEQRPMRAQLIRQLIAENFLAADMARESLKDHWNKLSQEQRKEFESLFIDLFQDSYTRMVLNYLRQETVEYRGEQPERDMARVQTLLMRVNEHIPVDYFLAQKNGRWWIRDVTIDGVSIVGNYQNQFRRVIQAQSFDELLKKMRLQSQAIREKPV